MEVFFVYLWMKLSLFEIGVGNMLTSVILIVINFLAFFVVYECGGESNFTTLKKWSFRFWVWLFIPWAIACAILPSQKEMAILVGTHYAVQFSNSPEGEKVTTLIRMKANQYMDEQISEINKSAEKTAQAASK